MTQTQSTALSPNFQPVPCLLVLLKSLLPILSAAIKDKD
jgi:hypothetical protein